MDSAVTCSVVQCKSNCPASIYSAICPLKAHTCTTYLRFPLIEATKYSTYFMLIASQCVVTVTKINPLTMWKEMFSSCTTRSTVSSTRCSYVQPTSKRKNSSLGICLPAGKRLSRTKILRLHRHHR